MTSKAMLLGAPVTQSTEAVVSLLKYLSKPFDPLPEIVPLGDGSQLTRSSKCDCYYVTSPQGCTCIGFVYRHDCRHMKILKKTAKSTHVAKTHKIEMARSACEDSMRQAREYQARQRDHKGKSRLEPGDTIRPAGKWAGGFNGPVEEA